MTEEAKARIVLRADIVPEGCEPMPLFIDGYTPPIAQITIETTARVDGFTLGHVEMLIPDELTGMIPMLEAAFSHILAGRALSLDRQAANVCEVRSYDGETNKYQVVANLKDPKHLN